MRLWRVHFDVTVQEHGKKPVTHRRALLVAAEDDDTAEAIARPHATAFNFGPRVLAVDWRQTNSVSLPLDLSALFGGTPERVFKPDAPGVAAVQAPEVTDAMVDAYLQANDAYWKRTDELPTPPDKWRTGTPREATRESLRAALGVDSLDGAKHG